MGFTLNRQYIPKDLRVLQKGPGIPPE